MDKKTMPAPTKDQLRMNLTSLQRLDPYICSIPHSASQVALYKYASSQWNKTDIEGTLFVYERRCNPKAGFIILNRLSAKNWIQPISSKLDLQLQTPFLLYKNKEADIYGIWFYDTRECDLVAKSLANYVSQLEMHQQPDPPQELPGASAGCDLAKLFSQAMVCDSAAGLKNSKKVKKPSEPMEADKLVKLLGRPEQVSHAPPALAAPSSSSSSGSVAAFFAQAMKGQTSQPHAAPGLQPGSIAGLQGKALSLSDVLCPQANVETVTPAQSSAEQNIKWWMPNADVVSVESLEREHRESSRTPSRKSPLTLPPMPAQAQKAGDLEASLKQRLNVSSSSSNTNNTNTNTNTNRKKSMNKSNSQEKRASSSNIGGKSYASVLTAGGSSEEAGHVMGGNLLKQLMGDTQGLAGNPDPTVEQQQQQLQQQQQQQPQPIQLLSPMVFASAEAPDPMSGSGLGMALPMVNGRSKNMMVEPLTKGQFVQALQHLLHTDDDFVNKLHMAYVDTLSLKLQP